jgi:hypothetical protein
MAISMHRISVQTYAPQLRALSGILDKGEAFATARKIDPDALLRARLAPDMFHLVRQVQAATDQARNVARLAGSEPLKIENTEASFADLRGRIARSVEFVEALPAAAFDGAEGRTLALTMGGQAREVNGLDYLLGSIQPNFYFHVTAAYAILRHNGVEIGKRDFMGRR